MSLGCDENDLVHLKLGEDTAVIHLFGATILSWRTGRERSENLFLSKTAVFDNKKAIRGGVPFVFPNFGPWSLGPQHGFARTSMWSLSEREPHEAVLRLTETEATLAMWPFKFEIKYTVTLASDALHMTVDVRNTDTKPWDFTLLLHSYLRVSDIASTSIKGLEKAFYIDKIHGKNSSQEGDVRIDAAIDRVYCSTNDVLEVSDGSRTIIVEKRGLPETVVWNPWIEGSAKTSDLDDDAWERMVCVEPGKVQDRVTLQAKEVFIAKASLRLAK
ncbi:putative glucose-6-phosphate 1-epimerase [Galendromus occidentalis]|uniref:glucose-6-phosphate 1-epimerase n=1 Tax=Galendromus occidentalis TaxID=34638 RepID=A0AAJ6QUI2_9ACAR|nr:putative glucose-6-phosphate 1-epimerase [Galendromus occidentalis]